MVKYDWKKTFWKIIKEVIIWGVPQLVTVLIVGTGQYAEMTIAAFISLVARWIVDYAKHK